jgi:hypothetical protein
MASANGRVLGIEPARRATRPRREYWRALLRDGAEFQPARLGVEEGPFTQTITRRFRLTPKSAGRLTSL